MSEPEVAAPETAPVDDAAPAAAPETTPASADDLDSVLASIREYREETSAPPVEPQHQRSAEDHGQRSDGVAQSGGPEETGATPAAAPRAPDDGRVAAIEARIIRDDINRATNAMKESQPALKGVDGDVLEAYLNSQAIRDPRIRTAWNNRDRDRSTFNKVVNGLARRFAATLPVPVDEAAAGERGAAITAARGSTQQVTADAEDQKVVSMSDAEFDEHYAKIARAS